MRDSVAGEDGPNWLHLASFTRESRYPTGPRWGRIEAGMGCFDAGMRPNEATAPSRLPASGLAARMLVAPPIRNSVRGQAVTAKGAGVTNPGNQHRCTGWTGWRSSLFLRRQEQRSPRPSFQWRLESRGRWMRVFPPVPAKAGIHGAPSGIADYLRFEDVDRRAKLCSKRYAEIDLALRFLRHAFP